MKKAELEAKIDGLADQMGSLANVVGGLVSIVDGMRQGEVPMPTVPKVTAPTPAKEKKAGALHLPCTLVLEGDTDDAGEPLLSSSGKSVSFKVPKTAPISVGQTLWIKRESFGDSIPATITLTIK